MTPAPSPGRATVTPAPRPAASSVPPAPRAARERLGAPSASTSTPSGWDYEVAARALRGVGHGGIFIVSGDPSRKRLLRINKAFRALLAHAEDRHVAYWARHDRRRFGTSKQRRLVAEYMAEATGANGTWE